MRALCGPKYYGVCFPVATVATADWLCGAGCVLAWNLWEGKQGKREPDRFEPRDPHVWVRKGKSLIATDCQSVPRESGKMRRFLRVSQMFSQRRLRRFIRWSRNTCACVRVAFLFSRGFSFKRFGETGGGGGRSRPSELKSFPSTQCLCIRCR